MELFNRKGQNGRKQSRFYQKRIEINRILSECKEYIIEWSFVVIEYNILEWSEHSRVEQNFIRIGRIEQYSTVSELNRLEGHIIHLYQNRIEQFYQNRIDQNGILSEHQNRIVLYWNVIEYGFIREEDIRMEFQHHILSEECRIEWCFIRIKQNRIDFYQNRRAKNRRGFYWNRIENRRVLSECIRMEFT